MSSNHLSYPEDSFIFYANKEYVILKDTSAQEIQREVQKQLSLNPNDIKWLNIQTQLTHNYQNNYREALQIIKKILFIDPENIDARIDLIVILIEYHIERWEEIVSIADECFQRDSTYWRIYYESGALYDKLNQEKKARQIIMEGLELNPNNAYLLSYLGQIYSDKSSLKKETKQIFDIILAQNKKDYEILKNLAYICGGMSDNDQQQMFLERSLKLNQNSISALNNYALILEDRDKSNIPKCIELWSKAIQINPSSFNTCLNLGLAYQELQQLETSILYFKRAAESKKLETPYWKLCKLFQMIGREPETIYYSQKAIQNFPQEEYFYFLNIYYLMKCSKISESSKDFESIEHNIYFSLNKGIQSLNQYQSAKLNQASKKLYTSQNWI